MTYEINTTWKKMHEDEITELNRIVSNEHRIEQDIARKLRIIRVCKEVVNKEIKCFNFDKIISYMQAANWTWSYTKAGKNMVPTKEDFIETINTDFLEPALYNFIERKENRYAATTGGISFTLSCKNLDYADETNTFCEIEFNINFPD